ncbi:ABC transporter ATP-binding protein [Acidiferrobacter thiooxydans]|jgi:oligopeptide/dipeptide ABC transporter ATP-binding protein|uniref:ABC transporter ATP-binding protein n=1 Tax=Acidiferrobacter thiooxydans TaxID=163359 RepID=UPI000824C375|nr:ABC transporter ATP-binding protein [Acidiferrobacter thiooxydans]MDA8190824.1 ABC transporter ATP-binding protein [Gammaproteobacteria bacterium]UEN99549.1 ABC transporter ATP-binding protein [Acidiferrobacter thiooxydans]
MTTDRPVLAVSGLTLGVTRDRRARALVDDLSFEVARGEMLAFVGESGSGKSLTAAAIFGLLPSGIQRLAGSIRVNGTELTTLSDRRLRAWRGRDMGLIFQNPLTALSPSVGVQAQIAETYRVHKGGTRDAARARARALLAEVGLQALAAGPDHYPHQLSGGMRQRVMIALALVCDPALIIADEPTTALDVLIQAQILDLLARLQRERGLAVVFITHDLRLAARYADRILVLYAGCAVEEGDAAQFFTAPRHPYSRALRDAIPTIPSTGGRLAEIPGQPPGPEPLPTGCRFAPRCANVREDCRHTEPVMTHDGTRFACLHPYARTP